jgi:hypothetical protein
LIAVRSGTDGKLSVPETIDFRSYLSMSSKTQFLPVMVVVLMGARVALAQVEPSGQVGPVPDAIRDEFELSAFYQKHIDVDGFPVVGSAKVSDAALAEAAWILRHMLGQRSDILKAMAAKNVHLVVMAWNEFTTEGLAGQLRRGERAVLS